MVLLYPLCILHQRNTSAKGCWRKEKKKKEKKTGYVFPFMQVKDAQKSHSYLDFPSRWKTDSLASPRYRGGWRSAGRQRDEGAGRRGCWDSLPESREDGRIRKERGAALLLTACGRGLRLCREQRRKRGRGGVADEGGVPWARPPKTG